MNNPDGELLEFYKSEMVSLKQLYQEKCDLLLLKDQLLAFKDEEVARLNAMVINLKENNEGLSETFSQFKQFTQSQQNELELKIASLSVEKADKEYQLDQLNQELRQIKRAYVENQSYVHELEMRARQSSDNLSVQSAEEFPIKHRQSAECHSLEEYKGAGQKQRKNLKRSLEMQQQLPAPKKKPPAKNKKQDIQEILNQLPTSDYKILYEEEFNKIKDTSQKKFEILIWEKEIMSQFQEKPKNQKKISEKLSSYIRNSFPEQFRGKLWSHLIGNKLYIKESLYEKLLASIPNHPLVTLELLNLINNDLQRTYSIINDFHDADRLKDELRELLIIFSIYRPDIGYVQGMTYLAFMLLLRMPKAQAFRCFCNLLLQSRLLRSFYQFESEKMDAYFAVFDQYLADKLPSVYKHFENLAIPKQSFLVEWFYTVYARAFNLVVSSKVWDYFLFEGDVFLIKLAIAILAILENELLNSEYENLLLQLRSLAHKIDNTQLFKQVHKIKIEPSSFKNKLLNCKIA